MGRPRRCDRGFGMKWRIVLELVGADGTVGVHEVIGGAAGAEYAPRMIRADAGGRKTDAFSRATPSCPRTDGGPLPPPAMWGAAARQRSALPAVGVAVWCGGGPGAALYPVSVYGHLPSDAQPRLLRSCPTDARPNTSGSL
jgi:hypothetical protein